MISSQDIAPDKALHFIGGSVAASACAAVAMLLGLDALAGGVALLGAVAAGMIKELLDWQANERTRAEGLLATHTVDPMDAVATAADAVPVMLPLLAPALMAMLGASP